jgi:voltage-gated potassium channel
MKSPFSPAAIKIYSYELFILAISILAILNIIIVGFVDDTDMNEVLVIINFVLSLILLIDFSYRLFSAKDKLNYFIYRYGWLDLLGSLPLFWMPIFRLIRIIRVIRFFRQIGIVGILRESKNRPASSLLGLVSFLVILVIQFGSYFIIGVESASDIANITAPLDALWWSVVTITTVGYGDTFPVTNLGRVIGSLVIFLGVIMFSALTSFFTNKFSERGQADSEKLLTAAEFDIRELHSMLENQTRTLEALERRLERIEGKINRDKV